MNSLPNGMVFREKTPHQVRCDLNNCNNVTHTPYRATIGGNVYKLCGKLHVEIARQNYEKNVRLGLSPTNSTPIEEMPDGGDQNIE